MGILSELRPGRVWKFFEEICGIPHGSYHEKALSDYCVAFAKERGLFVWQDKTYNVVIVKEASAGYENKEPLILQGHLDMVCEKKPECTIDFEKDGLSLGIDGDFVYANGTTLGGDDGIAIAYALAILDDDKLSHPRLEVIFTTCEEVGMDGATALDVSMLRGHTMLNLDSEEEGIFLVGCAGGCTADITLPVVREKRKGLLAQITVEGLKGGHSGAEIDKGRANANRILAKVLVNFAKETEYALLSIDGGLKDNAIPRECHAKVLLFEKADANTLRRATLGVTDAYEATDPDLKVKLEFDKEWEGEVFSKKIQEHVLTLLTALPNGIISMSKDMEGLVQTSLNLGVVKTQEDMLTLRYSIRSSIGEEKKTLVSQIVQVVQQEGAKIAINGEYPAWEYKKDSPFREDCVRIYREMFGKEPKVQAIHAGLECGLFAEKIRDLDCVSIGPDIFNIHTTEERMSIASVQRMWEFLLKIIER